jgi:hypothetical protein
VAKASDQANVEAGRRMTSDDLSKLLLATFPPRPLPAQFFWKSDQHDDSYEFRRDLREWLAGREWTDITMHDWSMMGGPISVSREHLEPATFLYYLPSLLRGGVENPDYLDRAFDAILPAGRDRRPKSKWWRELLEAIAPDQSAAIRAFVAFARNNLLRSDHGPFVVTANEVLTAETETFWDKQCQSRL